MILVQNPDLKILSQFISAQRPNQFLQSLDWGEFQRKLGRNIYWFIVVDEDVAPPEAPTQEAILASLLLIKMPLRAGFSYYYCPRGPLVYLEVPIPDQNEMWQTIVKSLKKKYAVNDKVLFLRIDPAVSQAEKADLRSILSSRFPVEYLNKSIQPDTTLMLDLNQSEEVLINAMHQKTRYNIRLAEKKGLKISIGWSAKDVADFCKLIQDTSQRDKFKPHTDKYYQTMVETFGGEWDTKEKCRIKIYRAEYQGQTLAMNLMLRFGDTVTYLHGASSNDDRNLMAPYLLQWQAIKDAKAAGASHYDFWGIAPTDDPKHPWAGLTRFKKGFGGKIIRYWGTADIVYHSLWYIFYGLAKKIT
ncbi:MAG: peptidoglycan bridge formation glycyltransferase FemA/FemB family protein [Patescibacteria group bacterium]|nr:peptidoglycan bridge formation glycyltransferase FemA/FemB family protein [Patescibacteria group bacterium]